MVGLPDALGWLQAALLGLLPGKPMSLDNFRQLLDRRAAFSKRGAGEKPDKSRLN